MLPNGQPLNLAARPGSTDKAAACRNALRLPTSRSSIIMQNNHHPTTCQKALAAEQVSCVLEVGPPWIPWDERRVMKALDPKVATDARGWVRLTSSGPHTGDSQTAALFARERTRPADARARSVACPLTNAKA